MSLHAHVILLRVAFELAGFVVVTAFTNLLRDGQVDLETFMRQHRPKVIVYDVGVPYEQNWRLFEHIRAAPACVGVTSGNSPAANRYTRSSASPTTSRRL